MLLFRVHCLDFNIEGSFFEGQREKVEKLGSYKEKRCGAFLFQESGGIGCVGIGEKGVEWLESEKQ